jgi:hypothetical protein
MLVEIFCEIDDFCKFYAKEAGIKLIGNTKQAGRKSQLSASEILTITVYFHTTGFKNFKIYYRTMIQGFLKDAFSNTVSYNRFIELRQQSIIMLMLFTQVKGLGPCDGISIIDSCKLEVCHIKREYSHKVFKHIASKGKTSTGWFFGFKLHLIINRYGEIISFFLTAANVADNNPIILDKLTDKIFGKLIADRGYIGAFLQLHQKSIHLIHKIRTNMKNKLMDLSDKLLLRRRGVIESVIGILKEENSIEYSGLRSLPGFIAHVSAAIIAYSFRPTRPHIFRENSFQLT